MNTNFRYKIILIKPEKEQKALATNPNKGILNELTKRKSTMQNQRDKIFTKHTLWLNQAPAFNFELDEDELLAKALESNFVLETDVSDEYKINPNY